MKNLNKKIGAVLLAGMVVAGGFAASGVQSFADSYSYYGELLLPRDQREDNEGKKELQNKLNSSGYKNYSVVASYSNNRFLISDAQEAYSKVKNFSPIILNIERYIGRPSRLKSLFSRYDVILVKYKGKCYVIESDSIN